MKTLLVTVALAAVVASPALAQTTRRAPVQQYPSQFEQTYGRTESQPRAANPSYDVYENGQYLGTDPDPNVRLELRRDFDHRDF